MGNPETKSVAAELRAVAHSLRSCGLGRAFEAVSAGADHIAELEREVALKAATINRLGRMLISHGLISGDMPEEPPSDLDRAQELLRRWREAAGGSSSASLHWHAASNSWGCEVQWTEEGYRYPCNAVGDTPLEAVRAAIAKTPFAIAEEA